MNIPVDNCSSCAACANVCTRNAITMQLDTEGFYRPVIDKEKCISCGTCEKICPWTHIAENPNQAKQIPDTFAAYAKNDTVRMDSSSGGIFSILAEKIIDDGGVVIGVAQLEETRFSHIIIKNKSELPKLRKSKYIQADVGAIYRDVKKILACGQKVLFSGTPCQVAALYSVLHNTNSSNLFTVDIVCHGIPSVKVFEKYVASLEKKENAKLAKINFKSKKSSWKKYSLSHTFNTKKISIPYEKNPYMRLFLNGYAENISCFDCHYRKLPRIGDITLGDFWGIEKFHPEMDDDKGTSVILLNTEHGKALFNTISDKILECKSNIKFATSSNPGLNQHHPKPSKRVQFFRDLDILSLDEITYKYCMTFLEKISFKLFDNFIKKIGTNNTNKRPYFTGLWQDPFNPIHAKIWRFFHLPNTNIRGKIKRVYNRIFQK